MYEQLIIIDIMIKLFLTSAGLVPEVASDFLKLIDRDPKDMAVAFVPTAADPECNKFYVGKSRRQIKRLGFSLFDVDLKKQTKESLTEELSKADVIFVNGGNTYYLLDQMRKSGFTEIIENLLDQGKIYVGVSAGSYVASPTIEAAGWKHADRNVVNMTDLSAINLVPFIITAHFEEKLKPIIEQSAKKASYPTVVLTDQQAVRVEDDKYEIVGVGNKLTFGNIKI